MYIFSGVFTIHIYFGWRNRYWIDCLGQCGFAQRRSKCKTIKRYWYKIFCFWDVVYRMQKLSELPATIRVKVVYLWKHLHIIGSLGKKSIIVKVNTLIGQNLELGSVFVLGECKCGNLTCTRKQLLDCIKLVNALIAKDFHVHNHLMKAEPDSRFCPSNMFTLSIIQNYP